MNNTTAWAIRLEEISAMSDGIKPIRGVVTGNDVQGRSRVLYDSAAPAVKANTFKKGTGMMDIWMFESCPARQSFTKLGTSPSFLFSIKPMASARRR